MADVRRLLGHKEWAPGRKSDPSYAMAWRRSRVQRLLDNAADPPEDDMSAQDVNEIKAAIAALDRKVSAVPGAVWGHQIKNPANGKPYPALSFLRYGNFYARGALSAATSALSAIGEVAKALPGVGPKVAELVGGVVDERLRDVTLMDEDVVVVQGDVTITPKAEA